MKAALDAELGVSTSSAVSIEALEERAEAFRRQQEATIQNLHGILYAVQSVNRERFREADADGSGTIDFEEFVCMPCNEGISLADLTTAFELLDVNSNGTLDIDEFARYRQRRQNALPMLQDGMLQDGASEPAETSRNAHGRESASGPLPEFAGETDPSSTTALSSEQSDASSSHPRSAAGLWSGLRTAAKASTLLRRAISKG